MKTLMNASLKLLLVVAFGATGAMVPICGFAGEDIDKTVEMPGNGLVQVENLAGRIEFCDLGPAGSTDPGDSR